MGPSDADSGSTSVRLPHRLSVRTISGTPETPSRLGSLLEQISNIILIMGGFQHFNPV